MLLSDGENTSRPDPLKLAEVASVAGVQVHTDRHRHRGGNRVEIDGFNVATALDEDLLEEIAKVTDGTYHAGRATPTSLATSTSRSTSSSSASEQPPRSPRCSPPARALLLALGALLSVFWFGRVV